VRRDAARVAGELAGDVQDPAAQPFRLADLVLVLERGQLRSDHDVERGELKLEPRRVGIERVER
jgi:hypothetical protein